MLQQTQVDRVIPKYTAFLAAFPDIGALARASQTDVLGYWSGLGYNRRALFLKRSAEKVVSDFKGKMPKDPETLETLPGVGPYTARAIATFSSGGSYIFIETNIRSVFIFEFFPRSKKVSDAQLFPLIEAAAPKDDRVREWYYALMDYGVHLKKLHPNPSRKSAGYTKQSVFKGSLRQMRGAIVHRCTKEGTVTKAALVKEYGRAEKARIEAVLAALKKEGFLDIDSRGCVSIKNS